MITINVKALRDIATFLALVFTVIFALSLNLFLGAIVIGAAYYAFSWTLERNIDLGYDLGVQDAVSEMNDAVSSVVFTRSEEDDDDEEEEYEDDEDMIIFTPEEEDEE